MCLLCKGCAYAIMEANVIVEADVPYMFPIMLIVIR